MADQFESFELCARCLETNGGLRFTRHRQIHLQVNDREACVDQGLAGIIPLLWQVCQTYGCCEDNGGLAYINPSADTIDAAEAMLKDLGLSVERTSSGRLVFALPAPPATAVSPEMQDSTPGTAMAAARDAVAAASTELRRNTVAIGHALITEARDRLAVAEREMTTVMSQEANAFDRQRLPGFLLRAAVFTASCWLFASSAAAVFGGSAAPTIVGGIVGYGVAMLVNEKATAWTRRTLGRRADPPQPLNRHGSPNMLLPAGYRLTQVHSLIAAARLAIAGAVAQHQMQRQSYRRRGGAWSRRRENDDVVRLLAVVDVSLALAGDALQSWLQERHG